MVFSALAARGAFAHHLSVHEIHFFFLLFLFCVVLAEIKNEINDVNF